ncbi:PAS-domain containing protein [Plastorhodobacter daqingensis]|uniref:histidine kinase n=1 Tax=Plastorhodobacter daqingensis TaxID=1387281 RepID=A0ABW2UQJ8_9RHOB
MDTDRSKLMQSGLNLIQQALSIYDRDLRLAASNARFAEMFDLPDALYQPGAAFEDTIRHLVQRGEYGPVADPDQAVAQRVEAARTFQPHYMERQRPNGRWISVEGAPLAQGGWVTVYTDITEIKHQEALLRARSEELSGQLLTHAERLSQANRALAATNAALEEAKRDLTEAEARIRLTTEMMPAHIAHVGRDLRYTYSNRRLSAVIPGRPTDILGLHWRDALGEEAFEKLEPALQRALTGLPSVQEFTHGESGRRIRAAFTPDRDAQGAVNGAYILSMDVTEETQARAALMQTRKRELAAQLSSGLAHDFGNLLTIILGLQDRLSRSGLDAAAAELVAATQVAARRGGVLLDRLAALSGRREMRPVATDLRVFLADLRALAQPSLPNDVILDVDARTLDSPLLIDAGSLQDSLLNLILNARDAIGCAAGAIRISATALRETWLEISVSDTGPGFSPEALSRALDPFFTTKGAAGTGLGLSMVYDLTTLAGGNVTLSNSAHGAVVTLRLPLRRAQSDLRPMLVLLVEDDETIRTSLRGMLCALGHSVIEAATGDEALTLSELPGIDMVLSDLNLPGMISGAELAERIARRPDAPVLRLMTALPASDPLRQRAQQVCPVLAKPFDAAVLSAFIAPETS